MLLVLAASLLLCDELVHADVRAARRVKQVQGLCVESFSCARVGHFVFRWTLITGEPHERHKLKISCRSGVCLSLHILSMLVTIIITKVYMCHYKSFQMTGSHRTNDSQARSSD